MLKGLHNHIFAHKLKEVFTSSPLVLVYQTVGSVDIAAASAQLQARLDAALPGGGLRVQMCRMSNTVASSAGEPALQRLFQASNLLVGFAPPGAQTPHTAGAAGGGSGGEAGAEAAEGTRAARRDGMEVLLSGLFGPQRGAAAAGASAGAAAAPRRLQHKDLAQAFAVGSALPSDQPLVLLGAFYGRESIQLRHLKEWVGLDETQVYTKLLGAIEGPLEALVQMDTAAEHLVSTLDAAGPTDLLSCLDMHVARAPAGGGADAAAA